MTIFYSEVEPHSKYSPVMFHLSPPTRILNENPVYVVLTAVFPFDIDVERL